MKNNVKKIISLLTELPYGVMAMSNEIEGLVETSLNLGIMKHSDGVFNCSFSVRSGVDSERKRLEEKLVHIVPP